MADVKFRSPRDGDLIVPDRVGEYVRALIDGGVDALSTPTDPVYFGGSIELAARIRALTDLPLMRKDFFRAVEQMDESKAVGFDAVHVSVNGVAAPGLLERMRDRADRLGLEFIIGVHDEDQVTRALELDPVAVAINNRDIGALELDNGTVGRTAALLAAIPPHILVISESSLRSAEDVARATALGADAVLVGTALAKSADPAAMVRELRG